MASGPETPDGPTAGQGHLGREQGILLNPEVLKGLDAEAKSLAENLSSIVSSLGSNMEMITARCCEYSSIHRDSVENITASTDASLDVMTSLITTCKDIQNEMLPIKDMAAKVKHIKDTISVLEGAVARAAGDR